MLSNIVPDIDDQSVCPDDPTAHNGLVLRYVRCGRQGRLFLFELNGQNYMGLPHFSARCFSEIWNECNDEKVVDLIKKIEKFGFKCPYVRYCYRRTSFSDTTPARVGNSPVSMFSLWYCRPVGTGQTSEQYEANLYEVSKIINNCMMAILERFMRISGGFQSILNCARPITVDEDYLPSLVCDADNLVCDTLHPEE